MANQNSSFLYWFDRHKRHNIKKMISKDLWKGSTLRRIAMLLYQIDGFIIIIVTFSHELVCHLYIILNEQQAVFVFK